MQLTQISDRDLRNLFVKECNFEIVCMLELPLSVLLSDIDSQKWMDENIKHGGKVIGAFACFESNDDALLFKLVYL